MHDKRTQLKESLESEAFERRVRRGRVFQELGGGGILKKAQRVFSTPRVYLPYVLYAKFGLSRFFLTTTSLFWGRKIQMLLQDYDAFTLYMFGFAGGHEAELRLTKFFLKNITSSDVFYDVGANCGFYTYLASELCAEVHSFEPIPELAKVITKNALHDKGVTVNQAAFSDSNGTAILYIPESTGLSTLHASVLENHPSGLGLARKITVPTITIDEYVTHHTPPTFLKIDAEGAEKEIVAGGLNFFSSHAPTIAMEVWGNENKGEMSMIPVEKLRELGYRSYYITDDGNLKEADGNLSDRVSARGGGNFIFKKPA